MKRRIKITLGVLSAASIVATPIVTSLSFASNDDKSNQFLFRDRVFSSKEDALRFLIQNKEEQNVNIEDIKVVGDLEKSYADSQSGILNDKILPVFNPDNIHFAWKTAGGGITPNYEMAKNTYYNPGRVRTMYSDGFNNVFLSESAAKRSMDQHKMDLDMAVYQNVPFGNGITKNYNPLSPDDLNALEESIKSNIGDILMRNIEKESDSTNTSNIYSITFPQDDNVKTNTSNSTFDFAGYLYDKNHRISTSNNGNSFIWKNDSSARVHWTGPKKEIANDWVGVDKRDHSRDWSIYANSKRDDDKITARIQDHGTHLDWIYYNDLELSENELKDFLNLKYSDWLKWDENKYDEIDLVDKDKTKFDQTLDGIKSKLDHDNLCDYIDSSGSEVFNNGALSDSYNVILRKIIKSKIDKLKNSGTEISYNLNNFDIRNNSNLKTKLDFDFGGFFKFYHYIKTTETANFDVTYRTIFKRDMSDSLSNGKINLGNENTKILNRLLNWKGSTPLKLVLNWNGKPMFDLTLKKDSINGIIVSDIEVASSNNNEGKDFEDKGLSQDDPSLVFMNNLYSELQNDKSEGSYDPGKVKQTMDYFFGDGNFNTDLLYSTSLRPSMSVIELDNLLKMQINNLKAMYDEGNNKNEPKLLSIIAAKIIPPKDMLIIRADSLSILPIYAKYRLTTMGYFNPKVSEGIFESPDSYAITESEWKNISSKDEKDIPAQILIAYDNNGQKVNSGGYQFDNEPVMQYNVTNTQSPVRDFDHVFIGDNETEYVYNKISVIQKLTIGKNFYYFKDFRYLKEYLLKYIEENSERI